MVIQGGANLVSRAPAFANDGKRLLVCTGTSVTVFSAVTTLPVLQLNGHTDIITSLTVVPESKSPAVNHVWTSSLDGTIRLWDFTVGILIKTVTVGKPIESMVIPSLLKATPKPGAKAHENIAVISVRWDKETKDAETKPKSSGDEWAGRVLLFNLSSGKNRGILAKTPRPRRLFVSPHGNLLGMPDKRKVWVWRVPDGAIEKPSTLKSSLLHHSKVNKVIAFDPTETVLSCGDDTGRILCWYNVGERTFSVNSSDGKAPPPEDELKGGVRRTDRGTDDAAACTTYHWHASEVKSILYSVDGTYLFSGGAEGTLVIWQQETGKQQFLPRLGGQLLYITASPDPSLFVISCSDNAIRFVDIGTMSVQKSCSGIKPLVKMMPKLLNCTRVAFTEWGKLVLPTDNATLQFYDPIRDTEVFEVPIAPRSFVSGAVINPRDGHVGPTMFVSHVTFSRDGSVMATVDVRHPEGNIGGSSCLKFWYLESRRKKYVLNTIVDEPHGAEVTALVCHPLEEMIISCSVDATFKVWVTRAALQEETGKVSPWRCRSIGSYRHKQMFAAAFAPDGSLLAVGAEELVTLWNPYSNGFVTTLACVPSPKNVSILAFVPYSKCLVAASSGGNPRLMVWDLSTLSVLWSCALQVEALAVDPNSSHFGIISFAPKAKKKKSRDLDSRRAAVAEDSRRAVVAVFNPRSTAHIAAWSIDQGVGGALVFAPSSLISSSKAGSDATKHEKDAPQSCMVVLTGSREYAVLNPYSQEDDDTKTVFSAATPLVEAAPSAFLTMYGKAAAPAAPSTRESGKEVVGIRAVRPWGDLLSASSHVFPPLTRIGITFMESLLEKTSDVEKQSLVGRQPESLTS